MERKVFERSKTRQWIEIGIACFVLVTIAFAIYITEFSLQKFTSPVGLLLLLVTVTLMGKMIFHVMQLLNRNPWMILDKDGIHYYGYRREKVFLAWSDIADAYWYNRRESYECIIVELRTGGECRLKLDGTDGIRYREMASELRKYLKEYDATKRD